MADNPWVFDVSQADFREKVVERSRQVPVVIDFWAEWCGPCRALGPLLEKLAAEANGAFAVAKVNVDENQALAGQFGVSGIPAVFAVRDATVVDTFTGLLPEDDLRRFLAGLTPSAADALATEAANVEASDPAAAEAKYRAAVAADGTHEAARVGLARLLLAGPGREAEAKELLRGIDAGPHAAEADRLRRVLALRDVPHADADLAAARAATDADQNSAAAYHRLGEVLAARGEYPDALEALIGAAERDTKLGGGPVRELMVNIFHVIGVRSPDAERYRDRLRALLY